uniref:Adrenomedullin a n=1 Tax=Neogobius melanostomus TaxID=47308 RepID=A0A8C6ST45_9GOBI
MKLILHSVLCGCLLATVAHCLELEVNPELKKRLNMWLENRLRRELHTTLSIEQKLVRPEDIRDAMAHSSSHTNVRTKRSNPPRRGCSLGTCTVHDLAHRLHQLNNKLKIGSAPVDKISPQGYGRRRRSVPERSLSLKLDQGRIRPLWSQRDSQLHKLEALLRRT